MLTVGIPMALANVLIWSAMVTIDLKIGEKMRRALTRGMETRMGTKTGQVKA
jgi:hypothetical protein